MKKVFLAITMATICYTAFAQLHQQDRVNSSMLKAPVISSRTEIILPEVNGYKIIKADLHVHTCYSDGAVTPAYSVTEGWQNGLDAMAITDHIEYRPNEKKMKKFLADEITVKDGKDLLPDLNFTVNEAKEKAKSLGITIIPGIEITRNPVNIGHFNALFTTDNNLIPDPDPLQSIRNAKKQGAIVQNNHPGWRRTDNNPTPVTEAALKEGLIDGVEVFNAHEFYPNVIEEAVNRGLYISSGTDIHQPYQDRFGSFGVFRNMTLILAKDASLASLREAIESRRTLAYAYGEIAGEESLLKDFFKAAIEVKTVYSNKKGVKQVELTNKTSFPYSLTLPGLTVDVTLHPFTSFIIKFEGNSLPVTVSNMWFGAGKHPEVSFGL